VGVLCCAILVELEKYSQQWEILSEYPYCRQGPMEPLGVKSAGNKKRVRECERRSTDHS